MKLESPFSRYVQENDFAVIETEIFYVAPEGCDMRWNGKSYRMIPGFDCGMFDLIFADRYEDELREMNKRELRKLGSTLPLHEDSLVKMVIDELMPMMKGDRRQKPLFPTITIEHAIIHGLDIMDATSFDALYLGGKPYALKESKERGDEYLRVNGRIYTEDTAKRINLEKIDADYLKMACDSIKEIAGYEHKARQGKGWSLSDESRGSFEKDGVCLKRKDGKYLVSLAIPEYHIISNGRDYGFPSCDVAVELSYDRYWRWGDPMVLGRYSHPFLRDIDGKDQRICMGNLSRTLNSLKVELSQEPGSLPDQLKFVLESAREVLTKGYQEEGIIPYFRIEDVFRRI